MFVTILSHCFVVYSAGWVRSLTAPGSVFVHRCISLPLKTRPPKSRSKKSGNVGRRIRNRERQRPAATCALQILFNTRGVTRDFANVGRRIRNRERQRPDHIATYTTASVAREFVIKPPAGRYRSRFRICAGVANSFSREQVLKRPVTYAVIPADTKFDFTNLDRWCERDAGERVGSYILYHTKLRK